MENVSAKAITQQTGLSLGKSLSILPTHQQNLLFQTIADSIQGQDFAAPIGKPLPAAKPSEPAEKTAKEVKVVNTDQRPEAHSHGSEKPERTETRVNKDVKKNVVQQVEDKPSSNEGQEHTVQDKSMADVQLLTREAGSDDERAEVTVFSEEEAELENGDSSQDTDSLIVATTPHVAVKPQQDPAAEKQPSVQVSLNSPKSRLNPLPADSQLENSVDGELVLDEGANNKKINNLTSVQSTETVKMEKLEKLNLLQSQIVMGRSEMSAVQVRASVPRESLSNSVSVVTPSALAASKGESPAIRPQLLSNPNMMHSVKQIPKSVYQQVSMMLSQNMKQATIRLDPPELGKIDFSLKKDSDMTHLQMSVQHGWVREAMEADMPRLREALNQQGVQLGEADIQQQAQDGGNGENDSDPSNKGAIGLEGGEESQDSQENEKTITVSDRAVDLYA